MFWRRTKKLNTAAQPGQRKPGRDPFEAVPMVAEGVRTEVGKDGVTVLVSTTPVPMRYGRLLGRFLGRERIARVILDENGTFFWRQIDGIRNLGQIANAVRKQMNRPEMEARAAVISFTKDLMKRNLLSLKVSLPPIKP
jgi:hypothetical protein